MDIGWLVIRILQLGPAIILLVVLLVLIIGFRVEVATADMERTAVQIGELYLGYPALTENRTVFSPDKLEEFIAKANQELGTADAMPNVEPLRHCAFGSRIVVQDINDDKEWGFGYEPSTATLVADAPQINYEFDATIAARDAAGRDTVRPAKLSVHLYNTMLTRATCAVEQAALFTRATDVRAPCLRRYFAGGRGAFTTDCAFAIEQTGRQLCVKLSSGADALECRYLPADYDIIPVAWSWKPDEQKRVVFYPLKQSAPQSACAGIETSGFIASKGEPVAAVLGCLT